MSKIEKASKAPAHSKKLIRSKRRSPSTKTRENLVKFCGILYDLPINFRFRLTNVGRGFDGYWTKTVLDGETVWKKDGKILFSSSFFLLRKKVFEAIEKKGWPLQQLYFPGKRRRIYLPLTKKKLSKLYYEQKKSLRDIARKYGCSRQNIMARMRKYGLKRRTPSEARIEAIKQGKC